ncbi:MAG TPA: CoA pyrophosphatase [Streptosporangiaceae bacterium]|nr:CoA pyrophosphatase [Streptosporangiaceae bacterium]
MTRPGENVSTSDSAALPGWLANLAAGAARMPVPPELRPPAGGGRQSAILILFGATETAGPDVLLVQRSQSLRRHAGQPAFPGGVIDPGDDGPAGAALREAGEETGVKPDGVDIVGVLPDLYIPRSGFQVSPVLAWWREPGPVAPGDPAEIASVARVPVAELADPANRLMIRYPNGGAGPAFRAGAMLIWGFTAFVIAALLRLGGWELPWDTGRVADLAEGEQLTGIDIPIQAS